MEMPKGYNTLKVAIEFGMGPSCGINKQYFDTSLGLLKEMAEALEYPQRIGFDIKGTPIETVLNKFKDWE